MVQFLVFHHRERPHFGYHIRTPYKKWTIIDVYEDGQIMDRVRGWGYLRVLRVKGNMYYDEGLNYLRKRFNARLLPKKNLKELRWKGKTDIYRKEFLKAIEGV